MVQACIDAEPSLRSLWRVSFPHARAHSVYSMHSVYSVACLQGIMAPFLLGDLGCTGDEARLADCPADDTIVPRFRDTSIPRDYREPTQECDAFAGTYAFVACGTAAQAGANLRCVLRRNTAAPACMAKAGSRAASPWQRLVHRVGA